MPSTENFMPDAHRDSEQGFKPGLPYPAGGQASPTAKMSQADLSQRPRPFARSSCGARYYCRHHRTSCPSSWQELRSAQRCHIITLTVSLAHHSSAMLDHRRIALLNNRNIEVLDWEEEGPCLSCRRAQMARAPSIAVKDR